MNIKQAVCAPRIHHQWLPENTVYIEPNGISKDIIKNLIGKCEWIRVIDHKSVQKHVPGSKVIEAFNFGLKN